MKDLTKGPLFRTILFFAFPIFLGNLFQLFYSLADTRIVGTYLGDQALAAVGGVSVLCNLMIGYMNGMTFGFAVPIARFFGAKNDDKLRKAFAGSVGLGLAFCVFFVTVSLLFLDELLVFMKIEDVLLVDAKAYSSVLIAGIFFTFAYNLGASVLRALGNSVVPLLLLIFSSFLNVGLDIYFINSLHMGVFGAGFATVLAQGVSALFCMIYLFKKYKVLHFKPKELLVEKQMAKELLLAGTSMAFMNSLVQFGTLMLQTAINGLGQNIVVAHTAARKVTEMFMLAFSITGSAMCTFTSQNMGAGKYSRIRRGTIGALLFLCGWVIFVIVLANTVAGSLIYMVTGSDTKEVIDTAVLYLRFDSAFYIVTVVVVLFRNVLQGLGDHTTPIFSSLMELLGKVAFAKLMVPVLGYWGVILAEPVSWVLMVIPLIIKIAKNPYMKKNAEAELG